MAKYIQANTDGRLHDASEPSISPLNRSFLYGDAIYGVWRTYDGVLFAFMEHWERLHRSAASLHMEIPFDKSVLLTEIRRTASAYFEKAASKFDIYVRLQLTRGAGPIGLDTSLADKPSYVILVQQVAEVAKEISQRGMTLALAKSLCRNHPKTTNPAWKTGNYLNNILCLREAKAKGADDALMLNLDGAITEAASENVFFVSSQEILTPPSHAGVLDGVTRQIILGEIANNCSYALREENIFPAHLPEFQECFITSTTCGIVPVGCIDKIKYAVGSRTVTAKMKKLFGEYVQGYCKRNPELRIF